MVWLPLYSASHTPSLAVVIFRGNSKSSYELIVSVERAKYTAKSREGYEKSLLIFLRRGKG
jgi:hypothetical protein